MSGQWVVRACACGDGYGDYDQTFDTMQEARETVEWMDEHSDASVMSVTAPDGTELSGRRYRMFPQYVSDLDWPEPVPVDSEEKETPK